MILIVNEIFLPCRWLADDTRLFASVLFPLIVLVRGKALIRIAGRDRLLNVGVHRNLRSRYLEESLQSFLIQYRNVPETLGRRQRSDDVHVDMIKFATRRRKFSNGAIHMSCYFLFMPNVGNFCLSMARRTGLLSIFVLREFQDARYCVAN
jgi:hypothetical protein